MSVEMDIAKGRYTTKLKYLCSPKLLPDMQEYSKKVKEYSDNFNRIKLDEKRLYQEFKHDTLTETGLLSHPKKEKIWTMAEESVKDKECDDNDILLGILGYVEDIAEIVKAK